MLLLISITSLVSSERHVGNQNLSPNEYMSTSYEGPFQLQYNIKSHPWAVDTVCKETLPETIIRSINPYSVTV